MFVCQMKWKSGIGLLYIMCFEVTYPCILLLLIKHNLKSLEIVTGSLVHVLASYCFCVAINTVLHIYSLFQYYSISSRI